jgi:hypothetical protein
MSCSVLRLRPGTTSLVGSAHCWPVFVWGRINPIIDGVEVGAGKLARIRGGGTIKVGEDSAVDLLYLVERKEEKKKK